MLPCAGKKHASMKVLRVFDPDGVCFMLKLRAYVGIAEILKKHMLKGGLGMQGVCS